MLTFWGVAGAMATASLVADIFLQTNAQALFAFLGAVLLLRVVGLSSAMLSPLLFAASAAFLVLGAFYLVQRHKSARTIELALAALFARIAPQAQKALPNFKQQST